MRRVFAAEFIGALVGRVADRDQLDVGVTLQRGQVAAAHYFARADNAKAQFVMISLAHGVRTWPAVRGSVI